MKSLTKYSLLQFLIFLNIHSFCQDFPKYLQSNSIKVYDWNNHLYKSPFAGGLKFPVFTNMDFNGDGKQDLVITDRVDNRILTFLNVSVNDTPRFVYTPQFENYFPKNLSRYIYLRDYNGDGLPDLFTYSADQGEGIDVYKNIGTLWKPAFKLIKSPVEANYYHHTDNHCNLVFTNVYMVRDDIPAFENIQNTNQLDFLTFMILGKWMEYYRNISMDSFGNSDSLKFIYADQCWGKFYESNFSNALTLGQTCTSTLVTRCDSGTFINGNNNNNNEIPVGKRHAGSTSTLLDIDGDGDLDLILGDIGAPGEILLVNGKKEFNWPRDTIIADTVGFPSYSKPVKIRNMPAAFFIDVNNDGKRDIIFSPMDDYLADSFDNLHQVWLYLNKGQDNKPVFSFYKDNFLQEDMIDLGGTTSPAFFDYDNDGDDDLFVATKGNLRQSKYKHDFIVLYENIGTAESPAFREVDSDYLGLSQKNYRDLTLTFGDVDGDGKKDLILGSSGGKLSFYKNVTAAGQKKDSFRFVTDFLDSISFGSSFTLCLYDFDGSSFCDLLIGNPNGTISYYRNLKKTGMPEFVKVTDTFGGIAIPNARNVVPYVYDIDDNGKPDLIFTFDSFYDIYSTESGGILFYKDINTSPGSIFQPVKNPIYDSINHQAITSGTGLTLKPAAARLRNGKYPDLIFGSRRGGLLLYSTEFDTSMAKLVSHIEPGRSTILCSGDTVELDAGAGFDSYLWNTGDHTRKIRVSSAGTYSCKVISGELTNTSYINITKHPALLNADYSYSQSQLNIKFHSLNSGISSIYWDFGDGTHSNISDPFHVYLKSDSFLVCMSIKDSCGFSDTACKRLLFTGINDKTKTVQWDIFPNPVSSNLNVVTPDLSLKNYRFILTDISGKALLDRILLPGRNNFGIDYLPAGYYLAFIISNTGQMVVYKKIIKYN